MPPIDSLAQSNQTRTRLAHSHPLAIAITFITILFLLGGFFATRRAPVATGGTTQTWSEATGYLQDTTSFSPTYKHAPAPLPDTASTSAPIRFYVSQKSTTPITTPANTDFDLYLIALQNLPKLIATGDTKNFAMDSLIQSAYAYIPKGIVSTSTAKRRTPVQEELHTYGNAAGAIIQSYENSHANQLDILSAQESDRGNAQKAEALRELARSISDIGTQMLTITSVPPAARTAHTNLAHHYVRAGELLTLTADAGTDDPKMLAALKAYSKSVDDLTQSFVVLVTTFSLNEVTFSASDSGSVFSFPSQGGF